MFIDADDQEMSELERLWDELIPCGNAADFYTVCITGWTSRRTDKTIPPIAGMREGWVTMMRAYRVSVSVPE